MNKDEIDFDALFEEDLPFKPLTKGLGFHHSLKAKKDLKSSLKEKSKNLERDLLERAAYLQKQKSNSSKELSMGDLAPFYKAEEKKEWDLELSAQTARPEQTSSFSNAGLFPRFGAFLADLLIVASTLALIFLGALAASGLLIELSSDGLLSLFASAAAPMGILLYFFYFSFFDKTRFSSPGKKLMGLTVISETGKRVRMSQAFLRAALTLLGLATFGLVHLLDLQSRLSDTKVVKK